MSVHEFIEGIDGYCAHYDESSHRCGAKSSDHAEVRTLHQPNAQSLDQWWPTLLEAAKRIEALRTENKDLKLFASQCQNSLQTLAAKLPEES